MKTSSVRSHGKRWVCLLLCALLAAALWLPVTAWAEGGNKVVRVGWYESPFNTTEKSGRRSGYAYEYQMKIASYTGWDYEYVTAGWYRHWVFRCQRARRSPRPQYVHVQHSASCSGRSQRTHA